MTGHNGETSYVVIGAGMAGLTAATELQQAGAPVTVLDKGKSVGGRMATRRIGGGIVDHGAQFFTVRDRRFQHLVSDLISSGLVDKWSDGFTGKDDGHPRFFSPQGINAVPRRLADGLDVRLDTRVVSVTEADGRWRIATAGGDEITADGLIMTPPVPQTLILLDSGRVSLDDETKKHLLAVQYDPCIALLAVFESATRIPAPGGVKLDGEPIAWVADNYRKGVSPERHTVTIHAGPRFSRERWNDNDEDIAAALFAAVRDMMPNNPDAWQTHRWRYAQPTRQCDRPCLFTADPAPLAFAGDAFGESSRIEAAYLSGLAAAEALLNHQARDNRANKSA